MNMNAALKIRADVDGQNKIVALNRGLNSLETTAKGVTGAMRGLTGASAGLSGALGTLAPLLSVAGLASMVKGTLDAADNMNDLAQSTGVSVEALSRFNKAAAVSGTNLEGVSKGLVKLNKAMVDAATGGKESAATFAALGVNVKNTDGSLKSADRVMLEVANRFKAMPDGAAKTALALRLFGKSGAELVPLLNMGGDAIDKMSTKMTTAFAQKADEYTDKLAVLGGKVRALGMDLTIALLPALEQITDALTVAVTAFNQMPDSLKAAAVGVATFALAWGPLSGAIKGGLGLIAAAANGMEILRYQSALAGGVMPMLIGHLRGLGAAILAIPGWGWVAAGVTALALLGKALYDNNEGFRSWVNNVGKIIATDFSNTMKNVVALGQAAAKGVSGAWQWLVNATSNAATAIANAFSGPFGFIANAARSAFGAVQKAIASLWNALPEPIRKALGQAGKMAVNNLTNNPVGYLVGVGVRAAQMGPQTANNRPSKDEPGPNAGLNGFNPDLGALGGNGGANKAKAAADKAKQIREALTASRSALEQSKAELAIERELDPMRKIELEYAEKRRAVKAAAAREMSQALSVQQRLNIEQTRNNELEKLGVQETNALTEAFKKLKGVGFEAAMGGESFSLAVDKSKSAMEGFRSGIGSYLESIGTLRDGISSLTQNAIKGLEDAIVSLTTTGTFSFREFALSIVEETTRMVTRLLIIAPILQAIQSMIPGAGGNLLSAAGKLSKSVGFGPSTTLGYYTPSANGNAFGANGIIPYAMGGVVTRPTLFPFANGTGLMGEAGPEAIMPLKRGADGKLGVAGGGGTNITVNVDAKGTSAQGDEGRSGQLARVVAQAVQAELIKQKRPGGLIAA